MNAATTSLALLYHLSQGTSTTTDSILYQDRHMLRSSSTYLVTQDVLFSSSYQDCFRPTQVFPQEKMLRRKTLLEAAFAIKKMHILAPDRIISIRIFLHWNEIFRVA